MSTPLTIKFIPHTTCFDREFREQYDTGNMMYSTILPSSPIIDLKYIVDDYMVDILTLPVHGTPDDQAFKFMNHVTPISYKSGFMPTFDMERSSLDIVLRCDAKTIITCFKHAILINGIYLIRVPNRTSPADLCNFVNKWEKVNGVRTMTFY